MGEKEKLNNEKVEQEKKSNKKIIKTDIDEMIDNLSAADRAEKLKGE